MRCALTPGGSQAEGSMGSQVPDGHRGTDLYCHLGVSFLSLCTTGPAGMGASCLQLLNRGHRGLQGALPGA